MELWAIRRAVYRITPGRTFGAVLCDTTLCQQQRRPPSRAVWDRPQVMDSLSQISC